MNVAAKSLCVLLTLGIAACASAGSAADSGLNPGPTAAATPPAEAAAPPAENPGPAADGSLFSAAQADGGRDTFRAICTECHYSAEFSDSQFKFKWSRRSAGNLYEMIFTQMPESAPGSLSEDEAVGLVSYIMRMNGFEPGAAELAADRAVLDAISLAPIRN